MIYFAQPIDGGPIKIGFSDDVPTRVRQLEAHYRRPLAVLATMDGGRQEEAEVHARFAHLRFGRTEQFQPGPDLMEFIGRPLFVNQGDVELMPGSGPKTLSVKLHMDVIESARIVAAIRNISMTDMLSDMLRPDLVRMEREELAKRTAATQQVKPETKRFGGSTETSEERATRLAPQLLDPKPDKRRPKS